MKDGLEHISGPLRNVVEEAIQARAQERINEHIMALYDLLVASKAQHPVGEALCEVLEMMEAGPPREAFLSRLREDAEHWADVALPLELEAYVGAGLRRIERVEFAPAARKRLFVALWASTGTEERRRFLSRVDPDGQFVRRAG